MTVTVRSNGAVSHYEVIENAGGNPIKWIGECYASSGSLIMYWTKVITTANIKEHIPSSSSAGINIVEITENGTFTVPDGVYKIFVSAIGGGGGSSGGHVAGTSTVPSYPGGAGGCFYRNSASVIPGQVININIGAGGRGGALEQVTLPVALVAQQQ